MRLGCEERAAGTKLQTLVDRREGWRAGSSRSAARGWQAGSWPARKYLYAGCHPAAGFGPSAGEQEANRLASHTAPQPLTPGESIASPVRATNRPAAQDKTPFPPSLGKRGAWPSWRGLLPTAPFQGRDEMKFTANGRRTLLQMVLSDSDESHRDDTLTHVIVVRLFKQIAAVIETSIR